MMRTNEMISAEHLRRVCDAAETGYRLCADFAASARASSQRSGDTKAAEDHAQNEALLLAMAAAVAALRKDILAELNTAPWH